MPILPKDPKDRKYISLAFRIMADFGVTIAVPVVVFVLIGGWLDDKYDKGPWFTILAFVLATLVSGKLVWEKAKKYGREYENIEKKDTEI